MSKARSAQALLAVWRRVAADADRSLAIPATNEFFQREVQAPEALARLRGSLLRALTDIHPEFAREVDYSWVLDEDSELYHPAAEALYQLHVLDVAATLWMGCPPERRDSAVFSNLIARYSRLWGGVGNTSPKARLVDGVPFIVVPFGWDELLHISLSGLRVMVPSLFPTECVLPQGAAYAEPCFEAAIPSWNGIVARTLTSELGCHDLLAPLCVNRIAAEVPHLKRSARMPQDFRTLDSQTTRCALAMLFSIAHEVGHHLSAVFPRLPGEDDEQRADRLATNALWDCPGCVRGLRTADESEDSLTIVAGALFFCAIRIGTAAENAVRVQVTGKRSESSSMDGRIAAWLRIVNRLLIAQPRLQPASDAASALLATSEVYCDALCRYVDAMSPESMSIARQIVDELHACNPDLHDIPALDRRIRDGSRC